MKIKQLSVFLENKPGQLVLPCRLLGEAGINILNLSLADTQQFGILRLLVKDWRRAKSILEENECVVNVTEVVAVSAPYKPGGLANVLQALEDGGINVEYMYAFPCNPGEDGVLIFRFEEPDKAVEALKSANIEMVEAESLYARVE